MKERSFFSHNESPPAEIPQTNTLFEGADGFDELDSSTPSTTTIGCDNGCPPELESESPARKTEEKVSSGPANSNQLTQHPLRAEDGYQTAEFDLRVNPPTPPEQAPWYEAIPRSEESVGLVSYVDPETNQKRLRLPEKEDVGLVGYVDPNTNQIHIQHGQPEGYRTQRREGDPIVNSQGEPIPETSTIFTLQHGTVSWEDYDLAYIKYVDEPPIQLQENLERTLSNQLGIDVVYQKDTPEIEGQIVRRTPYGEDTIYPPKGVQSPKYEDNNKVLERGRLPSSELPSVVFRGSSSEPPVKLENGFTPRGENHDLHLHLKDAPDSAFIPTSTDFDIAARFSRLQTEGQGGYVYAIQPSG